MVTRYFPKVSNSIVQQGEIGNRFSISVPAKIMYNRGEETTIVVVEVQRKREAVALSPLVYPLRAQK